MHVVDVFLDELDLVNRDFDGATPTETAGLLSELRSCEALLLPFSQSHLV